MEAVDMERAAHLRLLARRETNPRTRVRLLAIANVLDGMPKETAAKAAGVGRSTLYEWWCRYQRDGVAGLRDRPKSGRRRWIDSETEAGLKAMLHPGPVDPADPPDSQNAGEEALRGKDFQRLLKEQFGIDYALSSAYRALARIGLHPTRPRARKP